MHGCIKLFYTSMIKFSTTFKPEHGGKVNISSYTCFSTKGRFTKSEQKVSLKYFSNFFSGFCKLNLVGSQNLHKCFFAFIQEVLPK